MCNRSLWDRSRLRDSGKTFFEVDGRRGGPPPLLRTDWRWLGLDYSRRCDIIWRVYRRIRCSSPPRRWCPDRNRSLDGDRKINSHRFGADFQRRHDLFHGRRDLLHPASVPRIITAICLFISHWRLLVCAVGSYWGWGLIGQAMGDRWVHHMVVAVEVPRGHRIRLPVREYWRRGIHHTVCRP